MPTRDMDQDHHRITGHPTSESPEQAPLMLPYTPLPTEIIPADNKCSVHLFVGGINAMTADFVREIQKTDGSIKLTESEWVELFAQFVTLTKDKWVQRFAKYMAKPR